MCLKSFLLVLISLSYIPIISGQNIGEGKLNLLQIEKPFLIAKQQSFKITLTDSWFGKDKVDHFLMSAFLTAGSYYLLREEQNISESKSNYFSIGIAFSFGIAKEIRDGFLRGNAASIKDIIVDILGIGAGILLFNEKF